MRYARVRKSERRPSSFDDLAETGRYGDSEIHDAFWAGVAGMCREGGADIMRFLMADEGDMSEFYAGFNHLIAVALEDMLPDISLAQQLRIHGICLGDMTWMQMILYIRSLVAER